MVPSTSSKSVATVLCCLPHPRGLHADRATSPPQTNFKPRDKEYLAKISYVNSPVPQIFRRAIVDYHRKEAPGSIVVDSDNHYLYYVQDGGKAIRYGITVGEEAMAWSGIAKIGSMTEWPAWHPTPGEIERLGVPKFVAPGPDNPMGSRAMYLYANGKDTLFRIHGTNQPEYIGASISSGCIRMLNEDAIDLYNRVKIGTVVVVLEPHRATRRINSKIALGQAASIVLTGFAVELPQRSALRIKGACFAAPFAFARTARVFAAVSARSACGSASSIAVRLAVLGLRRLGSLPVGDLARRRLVRPLGRQQWRDRGSGSSTSHSQIR